MLLHHLHQALTRSQSMNHRAAPALQPAACGVQLLLEILLLLGGAHLRSPWPQSSLLPKGLWRRKARQTMTCADTRGHVRDHRCGSVTQLVATRQRASEWMRRCMGFGANLCCLGLARQAQCRSGLAVTPQQAQACQLTGMQHTTTLSQAAAVTLVLTAHAVIWLNPNPHRIRRRPAERWLRQLPAQQAVRRRGRQVAQVALRVVDGHAGPVCELQRVRRGGGGR